MGREDLKGGERVNLRHRLHSGLRLQSNVLNEGVVACIRSS